MAEYQIGDQTSKPQDLDQAERVAIAVGVDALKKDMSSFASFEKMMNQSRQSSDMPGMGGGGGASSFLGGGGSPNNDDSSGGSMFAGSAVKKTRRKGQVTVDDMVNTKCKFTGAKLDKCLITGQRKMLEHAWAGRKGKGCKTSTAKSMDLIEECNMLKSRMAWLPKRAQYDENMFVMYGKGHIKDALDNIRAERNNPHITAVISGTANDMQQYQNAFKAIDAGVQEQVYANASSQMKQKLNPLMSS
jgi:hypothetical protein